MAAGAPHRQGPHDPDRRARHAGGDGARRPHHRAALRRDPGRGHAGGDPGKPAACWRSISRHERRQPPARSRSSGRGRAHLLRQEPHPARRLARRSARARWSACSAATASARAPRSRPSWAWCTPSQGRVLLEGEPITGLPSHKLARLGIGYVPEDRRIFRLLTVMENLRTGLDRARRHRGAQAGAARQGVRLFPGAGRAAQPGRRHAVGRRAADAGDRPRHDAGAQDHPARRADRRADAAHGLADQQDHRRAAPRGRRDPAGRAERAADARGEPARLHHGEGRGAPPRRGVRAQRRTTRSSSSIWESEHGRFLAGYSLGSASSSRR